MRVDSAIEHITLARQIADYAGTLGAQPTHVVSRAPVTHFGAVIADSVLQAGVNYGTVVRARVDRICIQFPEAATLSGLMSTLEVRSAADFLLWTHPVKVNRFLSLTEFFECRGLETTNHISDWVQGRHSRQELLSLHGIGPKTFDYLACLVGVDCIAVDRHVRTFASEAGVQLKDYESLKAAVSFAADLLEMSRRDFDSWIWKTISGRRLQDEQQLRLI